MSTKDYSRNEVTHIMKMPPNSPDIATAKQFLKLQYSKMEEYVLHEVDNLATSGVADKRWCAIARTDLEKGFLALTKALATGQSNDYAKLPVPNPFPQSFDPPPAGDFDESGELTSRSHIEWRDYKP